MKKGIDALTQAVVTGAIVPTNEAQRRELSAEWQRTGDAATLAKLEAVELSIGKRYNNRMLEIEANSRGQTRCVATAEPEYANLMTAAPELLEACKAAVFGANHIDCVRAMQEVLPQIRAAIAKAGGAK